MKNVLRILFFVTILLSTFHSAWAQSSNPERYLAAMLLNLDDGPSDLQNGLDVINTSVAAGCNSVYLTIRWDVVVGKASDPNNPSTYKWAFYDALIDRAIQLNTKVAIRIWLGAYPSQMNGLWNSGAESMRDRNGGVTGTGYFYQQMSFNASQTTINRANDFVQKVAQRYNYLQQQGKCVFISLTSTGHQEAGYPINNELSDYSNSTKNGFRSWLQQRYLNNISQFNACWQTQYTTFSQIEPPTTHSGTQGNDWYLYKHQRMKAYYQQMIAAIKSVNSTYKVILDYGSVFDPMSRNQRVTLAFKDLGANTDGIKINDDVHYNTRFTTDLIRSNFPNKLIMNETLSSSNAVVLEHGNHLFQRRGDLYAVVMSRGVDVLNLTQSLTSLANNWIIGGGTAAMVPFDGSTSVTYKVTDLLLPNASFTSGHPTTVYNQWLALSNSGSKSINVYVNEDILTQPTCVVPTGFSISANPALINTTPGASVTLAVTCSGNCTGINYIWMGNGISGMGATRLITAPTNPGTYSYVVTASKAGQSSQNAAVMVKVAPAGGGGTNARLSMEGDTALGTESELIQSLVMGDSPAARIGTEGSTLAEARELVVSPNPGGGEFEASFYVEAGQKAVLHVSDVRGRQVYKKEIEGAGRHQEKLPLINQAAGMYLLQLYQEDRVETRKIILVK
ncbi:hypothetical protein GCM10027275_08220 [Rhabdobacter roseus]|uniref:Glycoside hydrolase family 42 N-terminal domain-containing protein n=1 Tax=Rhabdobacter roseus TaxID=1655419 RepID=A0A840TME3_9BACT|nr:beta-galactosidase [Rhabdobacter roseus]MBB5282722.1 hypothetical protein [Rhabdobacter roseus]